MIKSFVAAAVLAGVAATALASSHLTDGEVRKIDKGAGKLTLKHSEIKRLDMPGMTMVFVVKDKAMLETVAVGDKVRFSAEAVNGAYVVTHLERQQ